MNDDLISRLRKRFEFEAADEIERLRSDLQTMVAETQSLIALITAWVDADDDPEDIDGPYHAAWLALRKAVGR